MKRKTETAGERIRRIRKDGQQDQRSFGARVGAAQGTVSAWERDDKDRAPSADMYFRLATLATKPEDQVFFLQRAGLSREVIISAANKLLREQIVRPEAGERVYIPRVEKTSDGLREVGTPLMMPVELVPNPQSTHCFGIRFTPTTFDQWAIVDTADNEAEGLGPFWGLPVLVEFAPKDEFGPLWPEGLEIGMLFLEEGEPTPEGTPWFARFLQSYVSRILIGASIRVGMWTERGPKGGVARLSYPLVDPKHLLGNRFPGMGAEHTARLKLEWEATRGLTEERYGRAGREMRLVPGCKIIGRVITWWHAIQEPKKVDAPTGVPAPEADVRKSKL